MLASFREITGRKQELKHEDPLKVRQLLKSNALTYSPQIIPHLHPHCHTHTAKLQLHSDKLSLPHVFALQPAICLQPPTAEHFWEHLCQFVLGAESDCGILC